MRESAKTSFLLQWSLVGFLLLLSLVLRIYDLRADVPLSINRACWTDEGYYAHNAKNRALFGSWILDDFNPMFLGPLASAVQYPVFRVFGTGLLQVRLLSALSSLLGILLLFVIVKREMGWKTAALSAFFAGFNYVYILYGRIGVTEPLLLFFMMLGFFFWTKSLTSRTWLVCTALACFAVFSCKLYGFFFLPVMLFAYPLAMNPDTREKRKKLIVLLAIFLSVYAALLLMLVLVLSFALILPMMGRFETISITIQALTAEKQGIFSNIMYSLRTMHFMSFFDKMPLESFLALLYLFLVLDKVLRKEKLLRVEAFCLFWFFFTGFYTAIHRHADIRYLIHLVFPIAIFTSLLLYRIDAVALRIRALSTETTKKVLFLAWIFVLVYLFFKSYFHGPGCGWLPVRWLSLPISLCGAYLFWRLSLAFSRSYKAAWKPALILGCCLLFALNHGIRYHAWFASRTHSIRDISTDLKSLIQDGDVVAGPLADELLLDHKARGILINENFNHADSPVRRLKVTHILGTDRDAQFLERIDPSILGKTERIKSYTLFDNTRSPIHLYKLKK